MNRRGWYALIGGAVSLLVMLQIYGTYLNVRINQQTQDAVAAIRETQQAGSPVLLRLTEISKDVQATLDQLTDCVQPGGACFHAQRLTHQTDRGIQIISAACAAGFYNLPDADRVAATQRCVAAWIRNHNTIGTPPVKGVP